LFYPKYFVQIFSDFSELNHNPILLRNFNFGNIKAHLILFTILATFEGFA
jgi:hypothetical protein